MTQRKIRPGRIADIPRVVMGRDVLWTAADEVHL